MFYIIFRNSVDNKLFVDKTFETTSKAQKYLELEYPFLNVFNLMYKFSPLGKSLETKYHIINIEYVIEKNISSFHQECEYMSFIIHNGDFVTQELFKLISDYKVKSREEKINQII